MDILAELGNSLQMQYYRGKKSYYKRSPGVWGANSRSVISCLYEGEVLFRRKEHKDQIISPGQTLFLPFATFCCMEYITDRILLSWSHCQFSVLEVFDLSYFINFPFLVDGEDSKRLGEINECMIAAANDFSSIFMKEAKIKRYGYEILQILLGHSVEKADIFDQFSKVKRIKPVLEYISKNYAKKLTIRDLAQIARLSVSRFHSVFKKTIHMSPIEYLRNYRLNKAKTLFLQNPEMTVSQIGNMVGYPDQFHFSKLFKSLFGISPTDYRKSELQR